jgi:prolyl oligopeptidase
MLYGYGGFNVSLGFSIANAVWLENEVLYAVPNLRGGGEYGKKWHDAGTKMHKMYLMISSLLPNTYRSKYTSSNFTIRGGSNGGLLVGATMTQRPELMKVPCQQ